MLPSSTASDVSQQPVAGKVAQLLFARLGSNMPPPRTADEDADRVAALLDRHPLGGLILFNGHLGRTAHTLERLQTHSDAALLIASDIERGLGQQVRGAAVFPHAAAFGACGADAAALVREAAEATAREARAAGLHIAFAPVADVHRYARNPIIATRAFSADPERAAALVRAHVEGCHAGGLLATAKHFPGHGATREDSHETVPVVPDARDVLDRTDLVPFRAAIAAGVDLVMTAHVAASALDPSGQPATLSQPILRDVLRRQLGFEGVVISDSMLMGAVRADDVGAQAVALFQAGADVLLDPQDPTAIIEGVTRAVEAGELAEGRLDDALRRVARLRQRAFAGAPPPVPAGPLGAAQALAARVAGTALTVAPAGERLAGYASDGRGLLVVLVRPHGSHLDPPRAPLADALAERLPKAQYVELGPTADAAALEAAHANARAAGAVLLALVVRPAAWHRFGLRPEQEAWVRAVTGERPVAVCALGVPAALDDVPEAYLRLCTYSDVPASQHALADWLAST